VLLKVIALFGPLRATERQEALGMDIVSHGEEAYATGEGAILVEPIGPVAPERARSEGAIAPATS
jgi:Amt family ammonium transporter